MTSKLTPEERDIRRQKLFADLDHLDVPNAVKAMRHALGKTQAEYAKMADITRETLSRIETGEYNPTLEILQKIGAPFGFEIGFRTPATRRSGKGPV
jgi:DNA-binding XRE family transcriptional regulator